MTRSIDADADAARSIDRLTAQVEELTTRCEYYKRLAKDHQDDSFASWHLANEYAAKITRLEESIALTDKNTRRMQEELNTARDAAMKAEDLANDVSSLQADNRRLHDALMAAEESGIANLRQRERYRKITKDEPVTPKENCPRRLMGEELPPHMPCDTGDHSRDEPAETQTAMCNARSDRGGKCSEPVGHDGDHQDHDREQAWANESDIGSPTRPQTIDVPAAEYNADPRKWLSKANATTRVRVIADDGDVVLLTLRGTLESSTFDQKVLDVIRHEKQRLAEQNALLREQIATANAEIERLKTGIKSLKNEAKETCWRWEIASIDANRERDQAKAALGRAVSALTELLGAFDEAFVTADDPVSATEKARAVLADPTCKAAGEAWAEMVAVYEAAAKVLATEGDGTKAGREMHEVTAFYCALRDLRAVWTAVDARKAGGK